MATVYLARDLKHGRHVALKVLHPELAASLGPERFQREIDTVARLQHPHIISVYDSGEAARQLWFTMPFVEGESLRERLRREHQLTVQVALRIVTDAARALQYAHDHGVIHRDIKPENLLLTRDGSTLVADFGIARALSGGDDRLTETGLSVGTPAYMSPEQAAGERTLDPRTDVYSLGAVLYEMLAGEPPFTGPTPQAIIAKRFAGPAPKVSVVRPGVPAPIVNALDRALATTAADRFSSVAEFADALQLEESRSPAAATPRRQIRSLTVAAAALLVPVGYLILRAAGLFQGSSLVAEGILTARDQLVLTEFTNRANDSSLATAVTEAFRVDFVQSSVVGLATADRVRRTLRFMQRPDTVPLTPALGREVAQREGLKAVLSGEVTRLGDGYMVSAQVIGADSGQVLVAERETAGNAREIIPAVDRLSRKVRRKIGESLRGVRAGPPLESVTTGSLPALRRFSQASRLSDQGRYDEAVPLYEDAVQLDSNFAMAWRGLSISLWNLQDIGGRQGEAMARAYALRDRLTERERYGTEAQYYEWVTGDKARARAAYQALLAINPNDAVALTNLGLASWFEEDYATAADLAARAIQADSNVKAPYTNLVDAQVSLGQFAVAESTLARWRARLGVENDYHVQVGFMASARGDYDSAGRAFRRGLSPTGGSADRNRAAGGLAALATMRGQFAEARRYQRIAPQSGGLFTDIRYALTALGAELRYGLGNNRVVKGLDSLLASPLFNRLESTERPYTEAAVLYALAGKPERARLVFQEGERAFLSAGPRPPAARSSPFRRTLSEGLQAAILLQSGRPTQAAERFKEAGVGVGLIAWLPEAGMAYERAGAADSALAVYQRYLQSTHNYRLMVDRQKLGPVLRRVGDLYLSRGDSARAIDAYHRFVALWRNADANLQPQVSQVRQKLGELAGEPD